MKLSPLHIRLLVNIFRVILVIAGLRIVDMRIESMLTNLPPDVKPRKSRVVDSDEQRIAQQFAKDTLPGLIRNGLITKYERNETGTRIMVSGHVWKNRSQFFKQSFMTALMVYDRVERYQPRAQIVDSISGALYAEISPDSTIALYD